MSKQEPREQKGSDLFETFVAFAHHPDPRGPVIEIIQPIRGQMSMQDSLDTHNNQVGVQHLAFTMKDQLMEQKKISMERGVGIAMSGRWKGKKGECNFVFFEMEEQGVGTFSETIDSGEG